MSKNRHTIAYLSLRAVAVPIRRVARALCFVTLCSWIRGWNGRFGVSYCAVFSPVVHIVQIRGICAFFPCYLWWLCCCACGVHPRPYRGLFAGYFLDLRAYLHCFLIIYCSYLCLSRLFSVHATSLSWVIPYLRFVYHEVSMQAVVPQPLVPIDGKCV